MNVDFLHNQIIRDTITPKFIESFNDGLLPYLISEYGSALEEVQFYEDHLTSGLRIGGEFFYPLTVVVSGEPVVRCVSWQVSNYRNYDKFNPFSYKGRESLEFTLHDELPDAVSAAIKGKSIYAATGASIPILVTFAGDDKTFLAGKYSQTFIDVMANAMTKVIEREFSIEGLSSSTVVLELSFAPGTFMEHIVENTTYRRVLLSARGCAVRDLWIKWTRLDGNGTYTVSDNVKESEIRFELAEDVPGKIREREYRYLNANGAAKYQAAMSRKNITEWRDVMRRVIRRGEVEKLEVDELVAITPTETVVAEPIKEPADEKITTPTVDELMSILDSDGIEEEESDYDDELSALLKSAIGLTEDNEKETVVDSEETYGIEENELTDEEEVLDETVEISEEEIVKVLESAELDELVEEAVEQVYSEEEISDTYEIEDEEEGAVVVAPAANIPSIDEERIRYEIEQRVRREMEEELLRKEREAEELRRRLEEKLRAEAREKELLAEAAKAAVLEQQRLEKERLERERIEAAEREAAERRAEEERREKLRLEEEERARAEEEAKAAAEAEARAKEEARKKSDDDGYVSKKVKLIFKRPIDQSITTRIHDIIVATIRYYHKEDVYIKIKANIPDVNTVNLEFVKIPENEIPLLVNIIKVLGRSDLGISRATLD